MGKKIQVGVVVMPNGNTFFFEGPTIERFDKAKDNWINQLTADDKERYSNLANPFIFGQIDMYEDDYIKIGATNKSHSILNWG